MIKSLRLQNFRSYTDKSVTFNPETNIIVGPNATGKTNLLEAILLTRRGSSYRAKDVDLISFNKDWATVVSNEDTSERLIKISTDENPAKTFKINGHVYKRLPKELRLPVVLFEPNHLQLLNGSPEARRAYLDSFIDQISSEYGANLRKYLRALSQRNSLLKSPQKPSVDQLFPWNVRLSQLAGQIVKERQQLIDNANKLLPAIYMSLSKDKVKTCLLYKPQLPAQGYESHYLRKLESSFDDDLRSGFTAYGPHRDDFVFLFNNHPSVNYASRGELRTAILALKISELKTIKEKKNVDSLILLDDVYSELDQIRRKTLTGYLKNHQSFITTTDADLVKQLISKTKVITL